MKINILLCFVLLCTQSISGQIIWETPENKVDTNLVGKVKYVEVINHNLRDSMTNRETYEYDEYGKILIRKYIGSGDGKFQTEWTYFYDEKSLLVKEIECFIFGKDTMKSNKIAYFYNDENEKIKQIETKCIGCPRGVSTTIFEFGYKGIETVHSVSNAANEIQETYDYVFDEKRLLMIKRNERVEQRIQYNEEGKITLFEHFTFGKLEYSRAVTYGENGRRREQIFFFKGNTFSQAPLLKDTQFTNIDVEYIENGLLINVDVKNDKGIIVEYLDSKYEFDEFGNWVKYQEVHNGVLSEILERKIEYYE